jgi:hypothetical protein
LEADVRIEAISEQEVSVTDRFGFRTRTFVKLVEEEWIGPDGVRVGPELSHRFHMMIRRAQVVRDLAAMQDERMTRALAGAG